ncbi:MAG TPA: hypothetical protein ENN19_03910 [Chloroflexi bacterium]|nr:hypothetical protein [Chloroflexota bacterium]
MAIGAIVLVILLLLVLALVVLGLIALLGSERIGHNDIILVAGLGLIALVALACVVAGALFFFGMPIRSAPAPAPAMPYPTAPPLPLATGTPTQVILVPPEPTIQAGEAISITIYVMGVSDLYGVKARLVYDEERLEARGLTPGSCTGGTMAQEQSSTGEGVVSYVAARSEVELPFSGDCDVAAFTVVGLTPGTYPITVDKIALTDTRGELLPVEVAGGTVTVSP